MSALSFYDPLGVGGVSLLTNQSPIVGDPEPVIQLAAGQYLTTGDLSQGDAGEAGGLGSMAIEMWFDTSTSTPSGGDYIAYGPIADGSNRQWEIDLGSTGILTFRVRSASASNVTISGSTLLPNRWYHIVCTLVQGSTINTYLNGTLDATAAWNDSVMVCPFTAGSSDMRLGDDNGAGIYAYADVAFYRQALSATRVAAHYTAGIARGYPSQPAGDRITAVLTTTNSNAPRTIGTATRSLTARYMTGQAPLDVIREAVAGEAVDAAFFCSANGSLVFLPDGHRSSSPYNTVQATFDDDGTDVSYVDLEIDYSDSFLFNEVNVTREGTAQVSGQTQTSTDATSVTNYFKRPMSLIGLPVVDDTVSATVSAAMLAKYKNPMQRITSLTFSTLDPVVAATVLARELCDRIRVFRTAPGGGARIDQTLFIQSIDVSAVSTGAWTVKWGVSPL